MGKKFYCLDKNIWTGCPKFSLLRREYLSSVVYVLTNSAKISDITKGDILQLHFFQSDRKIWWKCCSADFSNVWDTLACWVPKGVLKLGLFLKHIYVTTSFAVHNFENKSAVRVIFKFKMFKIWCRFPKCCKKFKKYFCFLNNCIWISYQKFSLLQRERFSSSINVLTNNPKVPDITKRDIFQSNFRHLLWCWLSKGVLKTGFLDIHLTTYFAVHNFRNI